MIKMGSLLLLRFNSFFCVSLLWLCLGVASTLAFPANSSSSKFLCPHDQSNALLLFHQSFSIQPPSNDYVVRATNLSTWKEDTDCCSWDGVSCDLKTGHLIGLDLSNSGLRGRIYSNNTLFSLYHLQVLDLSSNDLIGPIPLQFSHLSKLVMLFLSSNNNLSLERVTFTRLVQNLTDLEVLVLDGVDMSLITPKSLNNISSSLTALELRDCGLNGRLLDNFFRKYSNLQFLSLEDNEKLAGSLTSSNQSDVLEYLGLSNTRIAIALNADLVNNLKSLSNLFAGGCNFEGSSDFSQLSKLTQLEELVLPSNNISGQFPFSVDNLTSLIILDVSNNGFTGQVPNSLWNLTQLLWLALSDNHFHGHIPSSLGNLKLLTWLDMSNNNLSGEIPSSLSNLKDLVYLNLSFNSFSSSVHNHAISLESAGNLLERESPFCLPTLMVLSLANNHLSGEIDRLHCSKFLRVVDLNHNKFYGPIPASLFAPAANLSFLSLSSNNLSGELSSSVCKLKSLQFLDLSNNNLTGPIPSCLGSSSNALLVLNLGTNKFKGTIPSTFSKGNAIRYLNFQGNELNGKIPVSLVNCKRLEFLNLDSNKINDTFPSFLETLPNLHALVLKSNELHGPLKRSVNPTISFPRLRIFDLSHNNFIGDLPDDYFDKFEAMKRVKENMTYIGSNHPVDYSVMPSSTTGVDIEMVDSQIALTIILKGLEITMVRIQSTLTTIDLSGNKFTGQIPKSIGELHSLQHFNISSNKFDGLIPLSTANLRNLETLDLSCNLLDGRIPPQLSNLTFLSKLNLSFNKLEGPIPQGNQFNTFENSSFLGNLELCGSPLTKSCKDDESWRQTVPVQISNFENKFGFGWVPVVVGYGCGLIAGIIMGYLVFKTRRPARLVRTIEGYAREIVRRRKRNARRRSGGRRN